ncbi:MAG TPA: glucosaminidase domain-containing protein [Symbiobacteriaceae bacterium]|nr:glucosaminidase domain-containing protein [Symbiobacteriaceae bacterium]
MLRIDKTQRHAPLQPGPNQQATAAVPSFEALLSVVQEQLSQGQTSPSEAAKVARLLAAGVKLNAEALALGLTGAAESAWPPALPLPVPAPAHTQAPAPAPVKIAHGSPRERFAALKPHFEQTERQTGIPWQIQAAQWALETGWGVATPRDVRTGRESFNLFGVKGTGPAGSVESLTTEYVNGKRVQEVARFRAYRSYEESILEHARLLTTPYYAPARAAGHDLKAWTEALGPQRLGYATDPEYSQKLWQIIEQNGWNKPGA